jgi:hypothetical protein
MNFKFVPLALGASLALTGCAQTHTGSLEVIDPADFGEANRQTYAAMVVDPDPQYDEPMATSAEHAADAVDRYREGEVKQPERIRSTESGGSGGE